MNMTASEGRNSREVTLSVRLHYKPGSVSEVMMSSLSEEARIKAERDAVRDVFTSVLEYANGTADIVPNGETPDPDVMYGLSEE